MNKNNDPNSGWILQPSKKLPGKFYYFNVLTGEKAWTFTDAGLLKQYGQKVNNPSEPTTAPIETVPSKTKTPPAPTTSKEPPPNNPNHCFTQPSHMFNQPIYSKPMPTMPGFMPNCILAIPIQPLSYNMPESTGFIPENTNFPSSMLNSLTANGQATFVPILNPNMPSNITNSSTSMPSIFLNTGPHMPNRMPNHCLNHPSDLSNSSNLSNMANTSMTSTMTYLGTSMPSRVANPGRTMPSKVANPGIKMPSNVASQVSNISKDMPGPNFPIHMPNPGRNIPKTMQNPDKNMPSNMTSDSSNVSKTKVPVDACKTPLSKRFINFEQPTTDIENIELIKIKKDFERLIQGKTNLNSQSVRANIEKQNESLQAKIDSNTRDTNAKISSQENQQDSLFDALNQPGISRKLNGNQYRLRQKAMLFQGNKAQNTLSDAESMINKSLTKEISSSNEHITHASSGMKSFNKKTERQVTSQNMSLILKLRNLTVFDVNEWYITVDTNVLIEDFDFINNFVQEDPKCRLFVTSFVIAELSSMCVRGCQQSQLIAARQTMRKISTPQKHIVLQSATDFEQRQSIIDHCIDLKKQNMHVVLITNSIYIFNEAKKRNIHVFKLEYVKIGVKKKAAVTFDIQKNVPNSNRSVPNSNLNGFNNDDMIEMRSEELICSFRQIMENLIDVVKKWRPAEFDSTMSLYGVLNIIKDLFKDKIKTYAEQLLMILYEEGTDKIRRKISSKEVLQVIEYGLLLIQLLQKTIHFEELNDIENDLLYLEKSLYEPQLNFINNSPTLASYKLASDVSQTNRRNFVKKKVEIIDYLKNHFPNWSNYKEDISQPPETTRVIRIQGKNLNSLKLTKNNITFDSTTKVNSKDKEQKQEEINKNKTEPKIIRPFEKTDVPIANQNANTTVEMEDLNIPKHENTFDTTKNDDTKIVCILKPIAKFEELLKGRTQNNDLNRVDYADMAKSKSLFVNKDQIALKNIVKGSVNESTMKDDLKNNVVNEENLVENLDNNSNYFSPNNSNVPKNMSCIEKYKIFLTKINKDDFSTQNKLSILTKSNNFLNNNENATTNNTFPTKTILYTDDQSTENDSHKSNNNPIKLTSNISNKLSFNNKTRSVTSSMSTLIIGPRQNKDLTKNSSDISIKNSETLNNRILSGKNSDDPNKNSNITNKNSNILNKNSDKKQINAYNNEMEKGESVIAASLVKTMFSELSTIFMTLHAFISTTAFNFMSLEQKKKNQIKLKCKKLLTKLENIIDQLKRITERESNNVVTLKSLLVLSGEDISEETRFLRYKKVIEKCIEQANILENALRIILALCDGKTNVTTLNLASVKHINIFE